MVEQKGFRIVNIDATIVAQAPVMAPHRPQMEEKIAQTVGVEHARVNVKATTTEGLGFAGRGEGIAAYAVVLVEGQ
jgi:2-C-methyl-D-erythritol 2,4-cyclodiphosphate synthase